MCYQRFSTVREACQRIGRYTALNRGLWGHADVARRPEENGPFMPLYESSRNPKEFRSMVKIAGIATRMLAMLILVLSLLACRDGQYRDTGGPRGDGHGGHTHYTHAG